MKRIGFAVLVLLTVACSGLAEETATPTTTPEELRFPINGTPGGPGAVSGLLTYPNGGTPALQVVAFQVNEELGIVGFYWVETQAGDVTYTINGLPPGQYWVAAYSPEAGLVGGYSVAVQCGLTEECTDHSLVTVTVEAGKTTLGADPWDWYAPEGTYPKNPLQ